MLGEKRYILRVGYENVHLQCTEAKYSKQGEEGAHVGLRERLYIREVGALCQTGTLTKDVEYSGAILVSELFML